MDLQTYLAKQRKSQAAFARELSEVSGKGLNACTATVNRLVKKVHTAARPETMRHIRQLTDGNVQPNDHYV